MPNLNEIVTLAPLAVILAFTVVIVAALCAFAIVGRAAFSSKAESDAGKYFGLIFSGGNFLRLATVVFCVLAVVALACAGKLTEGAVAVLSGISGFVLGGISKCGSSPSGPKGHDA